MYTISAPIETKIEIKKSIFICNLMPVSNLDDVTSMLKQIRKHYYDATHNCYSYILGNKADTYKYSDDGEPSQTAGIVIYNSLSKNSLTNVLCVVTRYFGGIKLGAGGLVRAYANSSSDAISKASKSEIIEYELLSISFDYTYTTQVLKLLNSEEKVEQNYLENVQLIYRVPVSKISQYKEQLISLTNGSIKFD